MSAEMPVVQGAVVAPGQVQPGVVVEATVLQPVAVVIPQGAVVGTVVAVQGPGGPQNLAVPIGYKPGMTWNVAFPPAGHGQSLGLNGMAQLLGGADRIEINQKVNRLEAASCGCYEQKNRFEVKIGDKDGPVVMTGQEESEFCDRCCCKPHHSLLVHLSPAYDESNVLVTLERKGCECNRCCFSTKPGLGCCSCTEACTEEIVLHEGKVEGKPGELDTGKALAYIRQPMQCCAAGGCTPTLDISEPGDGSVPHAQVTGPTCFGGCSELCCENHFDYTTVGGAAASGTITHLRPRGCCETCKAACTDSDNYGVEFGPSATPADKANMIAASIVVDYMFFEIDQGMCHYDAGNQQIVITCFLCFCYGCLIPCNCYIPTKADGAPPAPESAAGAPPAPEGAVLDAQPVAAEPPMRA